MRAHSDDALDAMQWVQQLYEAGVLTVREIARLNGVTERMIYKYARTGGWRGRRGCAPGDVSPVATRRASKACVSAARKARADASKARGEAQARARLIDAKKEREARFAVLDAISDALFEVAKWVNETRGDAKLRARMEPLQHRVMDAIEAQLASLSPRTH